MRILLVKFGPIGDVVMATPIVEAVQRLHPGAELTWVVGRSLAPLLERIRPAPRLVTVDDAALWRGSLRSRGALVLGLRRALAGRRYDLGLLAHANPRLRPLFWGLDVGAWRSFDLDARRRLPLPGRNDHHEHVRLLTGEDGCAATTASFPQIEIRQPLITLPLGPRVALVPGGARNPLREDVLKRWPLASYISLARQLTARGCSVVLAGGPQDTWVREAIAGLPGVTDAIGATSVEGALDLFAACDAVVAHDTGPMHLADLAGARLVALFGPTSPHEKGPLRPARILWGGEGLACRPCYDGVDYAPCRDNRCLQTLTPDHVCNAVLELIRTRTPA